MFDTPKTNGHNLVKVGMKVKYRGAWGFDPEKEATIVSIDLCDCEGAKYGDPVDEILVDEVRRGNFTFSDNHWAYGYQITEILG